ncbi:MAG: hypothetical protein JNM86_11515 [Phycisphaerae bacterium]|nr:hypothetical protein [Phycisphaerae bacterium]
MRMLFIPALALCGVGDLGIATAQGTEAVNMSFVGTATGNGMTIENAPWSFTGSATQNFTKKSGGGSTAGGFSARSGGSWFAQSNGTLFFSIEDDGIDFGSTLHIAANMPESLVASGTVSTMISGSFSFTTDEILFYSGTRDSSLGFFSFESPQAKFSPGLLFPGTHSVEVLSRTLASEPGERLFDRSSDFARHISLAPLPDGFASQPGHISGEFRNSLLLLTRNGSAALVKALVASPWSSSSDDRLFVWKHDVPATYTGTTGEPTLAIARDGDMVFSMDGFSRLVRTTPAGREVIPDDLLADFFVAASDDGDTVLLAHYLEPFNSAIWRTGQGVQSAPTPAGFVPFVTSVSPTALSGDGRIFAAQWSQQPKGYGLPASGTYIAACDGTMLTMTGDFVARALNFDGSIAGGYRRNGSETLPALRIGGAVVELPRLPGTRSVRVTSISEDGTMAFGSGYDQWGYDVYFVWKNQQVARLEDYLHANRVDLSSVNLKPNYPLLGKAMGADGKTFAFHATALSVDVPGDFISRQFVVRIPTPCPADLSLDRVVDDADFVLFLAAYDNYVCPESVPPSCWADLNNDDAVDDQDFVLFLAAYNELLCPL